jgi:hypothetical protein
MLLELERSGLFLTADEAVFLRRRAKLRPLIARLGEQKGHGEIGATTNPDIVLSMAALFEDDIPAAAAIADRPEVTGAERWRFPRLRAGRRLQPARVRPNKEMATRLFVSENTIKCHLKNIYAKLDVRNRSQAIIAARERGLHR